MKNHFYRLTLCILNGLCLIVALVIVPLQAQNKITTPKEQFGVDIGDDYFLVNYTQLVKYCRKLAKESPRMRSAPPKSTPTPRVRTR